MKKIKKKEVLRALKYLLFAASAGIVQFGSFTLLNEVLNLKYWIGYFIALTLSVVWNFTFNRKFTFKSINNIPIAMLEVIGYYIIFTPASIFWGIGLENAGWNEYLILAFTMIINLITEYLFYTFVVYRNSIDSAVKNSKLKINSLEEIEEAKDNISKEIKNYENNNNNK